MALTSISETAARRNAAAQPFRFGPNAQRGALVVSTGLAIGIATSVATPTPHIVADVELAELLRMMAVLKLAFVLPMLAITWWRFRAALGIGLAAGYLVTNVAALFGFGFIMHLSGLTIASLLFHGGVLGFFALLTYEVAARRGSPVQRGG